MFVRKNEPQNPLALVLVVLQLISKSVWSMAFFLYVKVRVDWHAMPCPSFFSHRRARRASDWWRSARDRGEEKEKTRSPFSPSRLPLHAISHRERERETSGYETATGGSNNTSRCFMLLKTGCSFPTWLIHIQALPILFLVRAGGVGTQSDTFS